MNSGSTSGSLLMALRTHPDDSEVWNRFVTRYREQIVAWCRSFGLQDSDCHDVSQEVLLSLAESMRGFEYDHSKSFRAWLKVVTRHAWLDLIKRLRRPGVGNGRSSVMNSLKSIEAREDLSRRLASEYDTELKEIAFVRVRMRVTPRTWMAFELTAIEGMSGPEAAHALSMKVAHVYVAKSDVLKAIREEIERLECRK